MSFSGIIGHKQIINSLQTAIRQERLAHAYIFQGQAGIGKALVAMEFVKAINCKTLLDDGCEKCQSCVKIKNNNHPDVFLLEPTGKSIKNKEIEDFQKELSLKPYESTKKIFIIKDSDTMTTSAQNRILKVLEEPPEYAIIIFISENPQNLLPTIKSRCQLIKFNRLSNENIINFLEKHHKVKHEEAVLLSIFSDGSISKAVNLLESEEFKTRRETTINVIDEIIRGDKLKLLDYRSFFEDNKDVIIEILDFIIIWLRDIMLFKESDTKKYLFNQDKINTIKIHSNHIEYDKIIKSIDLVMDTKKNIEKNVNFGLCIETMLLNLQEV